VKLFQIGKIIKITAASVVIWNSLWISGVSAQSRTLVSATEQYRLRLYHLHTGEQLDVVYKVGNDYIPSALDKLNYFLRDHRTGAIRPYDPKEFDLLHDILAKLHRSDSEIDIVCGYRSPASNSYLRQHTQGVAQHSQHMLAKAIDIQVPGISTESLRDAALALHEGGVGYYYVSHFVHVDVGPVRQWKFM